VIYRGHNTADWEFTNMYQGRLTHVLDRGFIVTPGRLGYAIELYGPDTGWSAVRASVWEGLQGQPVLRIKTVRCTIGRWDQAAAGGSRNWQRGPGEFARRPSSVASGASSSSAAATYHPS
jgi:hypothetical protein